MLFFTSLFTILFTLLFTLLFSPPILAAGDESP
jgi:hypothetical protein